ncbi:hypothetical protein JTE90_007489 [Oedothorax gibbosus]|uniref:Uncharacterized protein n=1 Tax=Oedothorax gibbosus TaxID=931172 RepID=A0AAV6TXU6_9ARAC|nr:hypothetical protein JTE90_007489 [Oedothorax gibbosus]
MRLSRPSLVLTRRDDVFDKYVTSSLANLWSHRLRHWVCLPQEGQIHDDLFGRICPGTLSSLDLSLFDFCGFVCRKRDGKCCRRKGAHVERDPVWF